METIKTTETKETRNTQSEKIQVLFCQGLEVDEIEVETGFNPTHIRRIIRRHFPVVEDQTIAA